jgi:hypothetical protein
MKKLTIAFISLAVGVLLTTTAFVVNAQNELDSFIQRWNHGPIEKVEFNSTDNQIYAIIRHLDNGDWTKVQIETNVRGMFKELRLNKKILGTAINNILLSKNQVKQVVPKEFQSSMTPILEAHGFIK